jgi:pyrophosphatase PpaX
MIRNVIFDLDGTLADSEELIINSFQHTYMIHIGKKMEHNYIKSSFGAPLKDVMKKEFGENHETAINDYREFHIKNFEKFIKLFEGAKEIVEYLYNSNINLGIVTSRLSNTTIRILELYDIKKYFKSIITADMTENHKPHPEPLQKCLAELNAKAKESIFVGDTLYDLECAKNTGTISAIVGWSDVDLKTSNMNPDFILNSYVDLKKIIFNSK